MRAWLLVLLVGCDPAPPKPVASVKSFGLTGHLKDARTGESREFAWNVLASELGEPSRRSLSAFTAKREVCHIRVSRSEVFSDVIPATNRVVSMLYGLVADDKRFVILKGGIPFHELDAADEEKAVVEALKFCKLEAAWHLLGNP